MKGLNPLKKLKDLNQYIILYLQKSTSKEY